MIFGLLVAVVVAAVMALVVGALIMLIGKVLFKQAPEFGDAYKSAFFAMLTLMLIDWLGNVAVAMSGSETLALVFLLLGLPISFGVYVYFLMGQVGYTLGQACAVVGVLYALGIALVVGIAVLTGSLALFGGSAGLLIAAG